MVSSPPDIDFQHPLTLPLHLILLLLSLTIPSIFLRRFIFAPLIIYTAYILSTRPPSTDRAQAYGTATIWSSYLHVLEKILFSIPEATFFRPGIEAPGAPSHYGILPKLSWALGLLAAQRGIGWNFAVSGIPKLRREHESRGRFLRAEATRLAAVYLLVDAAHTYAMRQPYADFDHMLQRPLASRVWDAAAYALQGMGTIQATYRAAGMLAVGSGLSSPRDWPPLFGSLRDAYSVRTFWGKTWHQLMRRTFTAYSSQLLRVLGVRERSTAWYMLTVYLAFGLSGLFHWIAVVPVLKIAGADAASVGGWGVFKFHASQAVGISIEIFIAGLWVRVFGQPRGAARVAVKAVGYVWTVAFLVHTVLWEADDFFRVGLFESDPVPWSIVRKIWK